MTVTPAERSDLGTLGIRCSCDRGWDSESRWELRLGRWAFHVDSYNVLEFSGSMAMSMAPICGPLFKT